MALPTELVESILRHHGRQWQYLLDRNTTLYAKQRRQKRIESVQSKYDRNPNRFCLRALKRADFELLSHYWPMDEDTYGTLSECWEDIEAIIATELRDVPCLRLLATRGLDIAKDMLCLMDPETRRLLGTSHVRGSGTGRLPPEHILEYLLLECSPPDIETAIRIVSSRPKYGSELALVEAMWLLTPEEVLPLVEVIKYSDILDLPLSAIGRRYGWDNTAVRRMLELKGDADFDELEELSVDFWLNGVETAGVRLFPPNVAHRFIGRWLEKWGTVKLDTIRSIIATRNSPDLVFDVVTYGYRPYFAAVQPTAALAASCFWHNVEYANYWKDKLSEEEKVRAAEQMLGSASVLEMSCRKICRWLTFLNVKLSDFVLSFDDLEQRTTEERCVLKRLMTEVSDSDVGGNTSTLTPRLRSIPV